ncbi:MULTISPECIES: type VI secretion system membrane subunit TssM [unclassified Pseudomonas]|uniref:type VI secretion system membrane subunit TssM n=1 Tax=unclassified Pseudomonas TaxID=196821 RepID=UPI0011A0EB89|nr:MULTISPECIES: type VI secretion system membrane subunit TssM [unclassified Pseudomonas]TWC17331.1 type VI secretion system protein ImpL [Pseudomonas sp. SJZ075]TWC33912.1 type VI secretion system protein ImpL [Pseudomonas sp. SJZ078]TWC54864.1 type VI secretion system protein ImpL [Pseudomonas sp. SJZ124]TWC88574.1 type VI secretion system protein ImpL [Pseudomonas sp. SJZ101]
MKFLFRKVGAWLRPTWVWTLLLALCAALLVWFLGPLLAVDDYKFWASPTARLLTISALLLGWGLAMVFINGSTVASAAPQAIDTDRNHRLRQASMNDERRKLHSRFKQALRLPTASPAQAGHNLNLHNSLPWYLLIGPPSGGKTSLLDCSGIDFFVNKPARKPIDGASATRYCDWYFSEQAVMVDTPGRYLTQVDAEVDGNAWNTLLERLRKRRRNRPLSGVLVTVPIELLRCGSEDEVITLACHIRGRLQELQRQLHVDAPIYLVLSKADCVPGFNEFFDSLTREDSDQVLGATFSRNQRGTDVTVLRDELEALLHRLNSQVITRMHEERDLQRRSQILDCPHQLGLIDNNLCLLVEKAFTGSICPLRGFYLTSASPGRRPRFIQSLLSRVIFPEADLAGLDRRERSRIHWGQRALYTGALSALGLFGLLWATGFSYNHERLEQLRTLAQRWERQHQALQPDDDWLALSEALDTRFAATRIFPPVGKVPLHERAGLYQGEPSEPAVTGAYSRELRERLLPRVTQMLEGHIRDNLDNRERLFNSLRAYLMLNLQERRDNPWLKDRVARDWSLHYAGNTALQNSLSGHFKRLLLQPFTQRLDESLVAEARKVLRSESMAAVVYRMLREQARHLPQYRLSQHMGPQGPLLVGGDHSIPGFYTRRGYEHFFSVQGVALITELLRDNWVLGEGTTLNGGDLRRLMTELEQLYFRDYADQWSEAIGQVALQSLGGTGEGAEQLARLTSAHSPILQMLVQVRENTRLQTAAERIDEAMPAIGNGAAAQRVTTAQQTSDSLAEKLPETAQKSLQRRFDPLHRLLDPDNGPSADLTQALRALDEVQLQLASLARASLPEQAAFDMARSRMSGKRDALSNLRDASTRLPRPISEWFNKLADDSWRLVLNDSYRFLNQRYQSELYGFYGKAINKRYPFTAHSASDVAINDFREFFKNEGIVDRFFERYLQPFVSGSAGHYRLRGIDGQSLPMTRAFLDQLAAADTIRRSFFAENPAEPQVQFKLEPYTLDPAVTRSEFRFGDKALEYRHGPILPVAFTWPSDAQDGRAALVLEKWVGRGVGIEKNTGPWSLFRLFDLMETEYLSGRDVRVLKADLGGLRANFLLMSQRTPNPFDMSVLRTFRMPVQL